MLKDRRQKRKRVLKDSKEKRKMMLEDRQKRKRMLEDSRERILTAMTGTMFTRFALTAFRPHVLYAPRPAMPPTRPKLTQ